MELDWKALAKEVRDSRYQQGLTMEALAERAGVSRMTIHSLEQGTTRNRMPPSLAKIEQALGWDAGYATKILTGADASREEARPPEFTPELERSIAHAAIATRGDLTASQIKELTRRVIEDLAARGLL